MKLLAIPATNSRHGLNRQLIDCAVSMIGSDLDRDVDVDVIDLNDYEMPIYSGDREQQTGIPALAQKLFEKIGAAGAVLISFAEHNGSYTAAWKNTYDWMSRIDSGVYQGKRVAMIAATPGPRAGAGVLGAATMAAPFFGADLVGQLGIPTFGNNFDPETGRLTDPDLLAALAQLLDDLTA